MNPATGRTVLPARDKRKGGSEWLKNFSEIEVAGLTINNRLTMAPTYLGYAGEGGTVSPMLLDHYRLMARSGVAMVVVENSTMDFENGSGSTRTLRADTDDNPDGLKRLAQAIRSEGALACLQINHAGRFVGAAAKPVAPSAVETFGRTPRELAPHEINRIAGPEWPRKVAAGRKDEIIHCNPECPDACMHMVIKGTVRSGRPKRSSSGRPASCNVQGTSSHSRRTRSRLTAKYRKRSRGSPQKTSSVTVPPYPARLRAATTLCQGMTPTPSGMC